MNDRPYRLTIDNDDARAMERRGELEGSSFRRYAPRSFGTESAAVARARNILVEMYDPRIPFEKQPHAVIHRDGEQQIALVHLPWGEIKRTNEITTFDLALSDLKIDRADAARAAHRAEMKQGLRAALGLWNAFEAMAGGAR